MNCPHCGFFIEEALELQYGIGDNIVCPSCNKQSTIVSEDVEYEDGETDFIFYLDK
jgi:hypothetical protein